MKHFRNSFKKALIEEFSKDDTCELKEEINKLNSEIAKHRESLKAISNMIEVSLKQLSDHYRYEIRKNNQKKLALENELITQMNPNEKANQIIKASRELPIGNNANNIRFRKLLCHVVAYSRDKLLFIIGNDNLKNIFKTPPFLVKGEHSYKIRRTTYKTEFGIFINK